MPKLIPDNVINPFSEAFEPTWDLWKAFRWEEHKFKYKGVISEQMALKRLVEVSSGEEGKAIRIIEQSISRGWMDFYDLKQPSKNGKSAKKQGDDKSTSSGNKATVIPLRERVKQAVNNRYGNGEQSTGEPDSAAV